LLTNAVNLAKINSKLLNWLFGFFLQNKYWTHFLIIMIVPALRPI